MRRAERYAGSPCPEPDDGPNPIDGRAQAAAGASGRPGTGRPAPGRRSRRRAARPGLLLAAPVPAPGLHAAVDRRAGVDHRVLDADRRGRRPGHLGHRAGDLGRAGGRRGVPAAGPAVAGGRRAGRPAAAAAGAHRWERGRGRHRRGARRARGRGPGQPARARRAGHGAGRGIRRDRAVPAGHPAGPGAAVELPGCHLPQLGPVQSRPHRWPGAGRGHGGGVRVPDGVRGERHLVPRGRGGARVRAPGAAHRAGGRLVRLAPLGVRRGPARAVLLGRDHHDRGGGRARLAVHRAGPGHGQAPDPGRRHRGRADHGRTHHRPGRRGRGRGAGPRAARRPRRPGPCAHREPDPAPRSC